MEWIGPKAGAQLRDAAIKSIAIALFFVMAYIAFRFDVRFAPGGIVEWDWLWLGLMLAADIFSYAGGVGRKRIPSYQGY